MIIEGLGYLVEPNNQLVLPNGSPNVAGIVRVYYAGTDDPATTYRNFEGTRNPANIRLDNNGRAIIIADITKAYRVEVRDPNGGLLWTVEPAYCIMGGDGSYISRDDIFKLRMTRGGLTTEVYDPLQSPDTEVDINQVELFSITQPGIYSQIEQSLSNGRTPTISAGADGHVRLYYYTARDMQAGTMAFANAHDNIVEILTLHSDGTYEIARTDEVSIYDWSDLESGGYHLLADDIAAGKTIYTAYVNHGVKMLAPMVSAVPSFQSAFFSILVMADNGGLNELQSFVFTVQGNSGHMTNSYCIPDTMVIPYTDGSEITPSAVVDMLSLGGGDGKRLVVLDKLVTDTSDPDNPVVRHTILYPSFDLNGNRYTDDPTLVQAQDWTFRSIPDSDGTYYETVVDTSGFVSETELHTCNFKIFTPAATFADIDNCVNGGLTPFLKVSGQLYAYVGYNATTYGHMFCSTEVVWPMYHGWNLTPPFVVSRTEMYSIKNGYPWVPTTTHATPADLTIPSGTPTQGTINDLVIAFHAAHNEGFQIGVVTWANKNELLGWTGTRKYIPVYCSKSGNISTDTEHVDFVLMCADATGVHIIALAQDTTNTFTTSDIAYGGGSPFDYTIFAPAFDDTAAYLIPGKLVTYNDALYRLRKQKNPGPWDASKAVQDDVNHNLGRIADAGEAGLVSDVYHVQNNATQRIVHGINTDLVIEIDLDLGEVPNFVVEVDTTYSVNCYIRIWYEDGSGMLPTKWAKYSNDAGEVIPAGRCQITCVGESWTWAQFTQSNGPTP